MACPRGESRGLGGGRRNGRRGPPPSRAGAPFFGEQLTNAAGPTEDDTPHAARPQLAGALEVTLGSHAKPTVENGVTVVSDRTGWAPLGCLETPREDFTVTGPCGGPEARHRMPSRLRPAWRA